MKGCPWTQLILTLTLWKTAAMSDLTSTSRPAMQQPQTDKGFPHRTFWIQIGAVLVRVLAGLDSRHCTLRAGCALAYRLTCTCARRSIWEGLICFILIVFKNILIHVAIALICRRSYLQGKCKFLSSFCPTPCGGNLKLVGHRSFSEMLKAGFP